MKQLKSELTQAINPALKNFSLLPQEAQVRISVVKGILSVSAATVWRMVRAGKLKTYKLTEGTTTFNVGELRAFLAKAGV